MSIAMCSDGDDTVALDEFQVTESLTVDNPGLGFTTLIRSAFLKVVDETKFVELDFYQSRGVYNIMTSRLPSISYSVQGRRAYGKLLAKVVVDIRAQRDAAFRMLVKADPTLPNVLWRGSATRPRNKRLLVAAMKQSEVVNITMKVDTSIIKLACIVPQNRTNRYNELWVEADGRSLDHVSRIVRVRYDAEQLTPSKRSPSPVERKCCEEDTPSPRSRIEVVTPSSITPKKVQVSIQSFFR